MPLSIRSALWRVGSFLLRCRAASMAVSGAKGPGAATRGKRNERSGDDAPGNDAPGNDERRGMAGAGAGRHRHEPCLFRRIGDCAARCCSSSDLGVRPILAHSEKAAAYMADGYARVAGRPGVCMAQSVGAANLASGLQDPWLGRSPVIALTGHKEPSFQHRNAYQEIPHAPLFPPVTKFSAPVDVDQRTAAAAAPCLARRAGRHAAPDASRFQRPAGRRDRTRPDAPSRRSSKPRRGAFRCTGRWPTNATSSAPLRC